MMFRPMRPNPLIPTLTAIDSLLREVRKRLNSMNALAAANRAAILQLSHRTAACTSTAC